MKCVCSNTLNGAYLTTNLGICHHLRSQKIHPNRLQTLPPATRATPSCQSQPNLAPLSLAQFPSCACARHDLKTWIPSLTPGTCLHTWLRSSTKGLRCEIFPHPLHPVDHSTTKCAKCCLFKTPRSFGLPGFGQKTGSRTFPSAKQGSRSFASR